MAFEEHLRLLKLSETKQNLRKTKSNPRLEDVEKLPLFIDKLAIHKGRVKLVS
jgi:hypothetical protein